MSWRRFVVAGWLSSTLLVAQAFALACVGDCDGDGVVTVDEILRGVNIVLGNMPISQCPAFDRDGDSEVTVDEIVVAVNSLLNGCLPQDGPTSSPTTVSTATATPTPSRTATLRPNRSPVVPPALWYRGYVGFPIALSLGISDPDGDPVECGATDLPLGAEFDARSWTIFWTPGIDDVGNHPVTVQCYDVVDPAATSRGFVVISVRAPDACATPACDPQAGCSRQLASLDAPCCGADGELPLPVPDIPCPVGRAVWISEDIDGGFRALRDCDFKYVRNNAQASAEVRFKFRARCFSLDDRIVVSARMDTKGRTPVIDDRYRVRFYEAGPDLVESRTVQFEVRPPAPFFDMQDAEANLVVTLTDGQLQTYTESLRLRLTFTPVPTPEP